MFDITWFGLTESSQWRSGSPSRHGGTGSAGVPFASSWANTSPAFATTSKGTPGWRWVGDDERGRELEVIAVEVHGDEDPELVLLVIHVMPTHFRKEPS